MPPETNSNTFFSLHKDQQQNVKLLKIYAGYRVLLSIVLLMMFSLPADTPLVGDLKPVLFIYAISIYLFINIASLIFIFSKQGSYTEARQFFFFCLDIVAITLIADATGGIISGMAILLVVIVAASSIILRRQIATLTAAIASLAILTDTFRLITQSYLDSSSFFPAGLLGFILFATSFVIQNLSNRIRSSQVLADQRAADVSQLQQLNQLIVQRMRTGILVVDKDGQIKIANLAASELLSSQHMQPSFQNRALPMLPEVLIYHLRAWQQAPNIKTTPFRTSETGPELQANFSSLNEDNSTDTLIFLEDNLQLSQRAQQMKLASLGRLTASIAHEIRNPLGAISHAAQLLSESEQLDQADLRLSSIIQDHCKRMNQIIENVLQLSRRRAANPERIELCQWIEQFCEDFNNNSGQSFTIDISKSVRASQVNVDASQLNQVLSNLFSNGLRYSRQHTGKASLHVAIAVEPSTQLPYIDIIDGGPGISDDAAEKIFEPFYTTEAEGTGLGLYISRELCEANQARLNYTHSDEGKSCFRISFAHPDRRIASISETSIDQ